MFAKLKFCGMAATLLCFCAHLAAFELALRKTEDVKHSAGKTGKIDFRQGVSVKGLISEKTKMVSRRNAAALLARDSQYLYCGIISELPADPKIKLKDSDTVFFNITAPNGRKVQFVLNSTGKGALPAGVLQSFKLEKKNYTHITAVPWRLFGISSPAQNSVWQIQMGRVFQSPAERTVFNLKTPVSVRMDDTAPALDFKAEKSSWATGYYPQMIWKIKNHSPQAVKIEGKADITWIGNPIQFQKKETLDSGKEISFTQLLSGGSDTDQRSCNMEFTADGKCFFKRRLEMGGHGILWQAATGNVTRFRIGVYPSLDTVKAQVYNRNAASLKDFDTALFQVVDESGKVYSKSSAEKNNASFYARWKLPRLKAGKYFVTATLTGKNGKKLALDKQPFEYKRFDWENNTIGLDRVIIPPFKPLAVDRNSKKITATLTGYTLGRNLLDGVTAEGKEILTGPVTFSVNGKALELGKLDFTETAPDRVRASAAGTAGPLKVKARYDVDYDGMVWITMDFDCGKWAFLRSMTLEVPMKSEYARYLHATCAQTRKHPNVALADKEGVVFNSRTDAPNNFLSYIWYGGVRKGLCWFTETEKEWNYAGDKPTTQVIRKKDGSTVLRIDMINVKTVKKGKFSLSMGFLATPVKPVMPNANKYATIQVMSGWTPPKALRVTPSVYGPAKGMKPAPDTPYYKAKHFDTTSWEPYDYSIVRMLKNRSLNKKQRDAIIAEYIAKYLKPFTPATQKRYRGLADHAASVYTRNHDKLLYYFNPRAALMTWEAYRVFQDEWYAGDWRANYEGMYSAEPVKSYQDYVMPILREFVRNGLDAIYYDCTYESASIDKVMFPDADNKSGRRLFMNMRRLVKRTATMLYLEKKLIEDRPFVEVHITNCIIIPMMSFASHALGWEIFYGSKDYQQRFSEPYIMAESILTQAGLVSKLLLDVHNDNERLLKSALALTMPYNLLNHTLSGGNPTAEYKKVMTLLDHFGYRDQGVEIYPCYEEKNPVRSADKNVKVMTLKMKNSYLLCAGNTGDSGKLDLDLSGLGFKNPCTADAFTGKSMGSGKRLTGTIPFHGYRLILVAGSPAELENAFKRSNPGK